MLPDDVKNLIESDYRITIKKVTYLSQGDNGSVCLIEDEADKKMCVKVIRIGNPSPVNDYEITKIMYESDSFKIKCYQDDGNYYIVMPFFPGKHLGKVIADNPLLPESVRVTIFREIIKAVDCMHRLGILHRDLKVENIMVNISGDNIDVKIIDFGRSVRVFHHVTGRPLATPESLSLVSTTTAWSSAFYPVCQFFRKWQSQTAPELSTISSHYLGFFYEAEGVGFRTDYYAIANLFKVLLPEEASKVNDILASEGPERSTAYRAFIEPFLLSDTSTTRPANAPSI